MNAHSRPSEISLAIKDNYHVGFALETGIDKGLFHSSRFLSFAFYS